MSDVIGVGAAATGDAWRDRWETPREFADEVARELGVWWALDAAADAVNAVSVPTYGVGMPVWIGEYEDAISVGGADWARRARTHDDEVGPVTHGMHGPVVPAVWLNPPYSELRHGKWGREAIECARHGVTVAMLVPADLTVGWAQDILASGWVDLILMPRGRVSFVPPHDAPASIGVGSPAGGTCVLVLGLYDIDEAAREEHARRMRQLMEEAMRRTCSVDLNDWLLVPLKMMYRSTAERVAATAQGVLL